jgi:voltage-gated potassium channel
VRWAAGLHRNLSTILRILPSNIEYAALAILVLTVGGTAGYMVFEGWSFLDALYMTVIVLTTIGFSEVRELDDSGRVFTIILAVLGIGAIFYALLAVFQFVIEGELAILVGRQRMRRQIEHFNNHFILCGFGRVGEEIAREFAARGVDFVIVESESEAITRASGYDYLYISGDGADDEVLQRAGIERAACLLAAADSDAVNTFIVLAARALRPDLYVVARAAHGDSRARIARAGADRVVSPYAIAGRQMALSALQPMLVEFFDTRTATDAPGVLGEIEIKEGAGAGRTISDFLGRAANVTVLAVQAQTGELNVGAAHTVQLNAGDRLIVLGDEEELKRIQPAAGAVADR